MTSVFGMRGTLRAKPGRGGPLERILLEAAELLRANADCLLYVVYRDAGEPDSVGVFEAWTTREAHAESLKDERVRALIARAMPDLDGPPSGGEIAIAGGKGVAQ